jgi:hypothetical protein
MAMRSKKKQQPQFVGYVLFAPPSKDAPAQRGEPLIIGQLPIPTPPVVN